MPFKFSSFFLVLITSFSFGQDFSAFIHYPEVSHDGKHLAFSYQGDIWKMDLDSRQVMRLTIHEGYESIPVWSPDDSQIAFTGQRYGNNDVYVIPGKGGVSKRLTFHSANDQATGWSGNDEVLFFTQRVFRRVEREPEVQKVTVSGNTPERMLDALAFDAIPSPDGKLIALTKGSCRLEREAYNGPANRDIWVYNTETGQYHQITKDTRNDFSPRWVNNDQLFFLSGRTGRYNVHKVGVNADGTKRGTIEAVTNEKQHGLRHFSIDKAGQTIFYSSADKVYQFNAQRKERIEFAIGLNGDYRFDPVTRRSMTGGISDYALSPSGKMSAFVIRGEVFVKLNNKEARQSSRVTRTPARERDVAWLNDTTLLYLSDRDGQNEIYVARSSDNKEASLVKTLKFQETRLTNTSVDEFDIRVAPSQKKIAYREGRGKLLVADVAATSLSNKKTLLDGWETPSGVAWSPDSEWLAYGAADLDFNEEIYIHKADNTVAPVNVSLHPKLDSGPVWSADGKKLAFSSLRNNGDGDIWFVWLNKEDWQKTREDWEEEKLFKEEPKKKEEPREADKKKKKKTPVKEKPEKKIKIDFEDIHERLVQVTALPGTESQIAISKDGQHFYFVANQGIRQTYRNVDIDLYKIKWDGKELKQITKGDKDPSQVLTDIGNEYVYYLDGNSRKLSRVKMKDDKIEGLPLSAKFSIDHKAEKDQIFEQVWRDLNAGFYDPGFHGRNWEQLKNTYKPWALETSTYQDFRMIMNWMLGQLNASHMGVYGGDTPEDLQNERTGVLGIEVKNHPEGVEVTYVLPDAPADREASKLKAGDVITHVDGESVKGRNFYEFMINTSGEKTVLSLHSGSREVVIRPVGNISPEQYKDWVKSRRELVSQYSKGRLGYLHIQGMNWQSFERFERELTAAGLGKEGIVIDVRYNGGGWTTDYLMAVLNVRQHAYTVPRGAAGSLDPENKKFTGHYPFGERLPLASWTKPSIALCNANSYSNAEIFSHAYKTLDIGTLVGQPTFGAVISTGASSLINGGIVRMPFRAWYVKATEENMEGGPAVPDILVNNPADYRVSTDEQLKRAVEELLKQL